MHGSTVALRAALEQGWGTSDRNLSALGHLGYCMAFTMDTVQVATGHTDTLIFLGCTRLAVEGPPEASMQTSSCPSGDSRCGCHSARRTSVRMSSSSSLPSGEERALQAQPKTTGKEEGRWRSWFHHQKLEIDPSTGSDNMRPSGLPSVIAL